MDRKLFGLFSGTHLTVLALTAIITPGIVTAAVTYSNVAIVNPTSGVAASVNASGWFTAVNPYSQWKDYTANQIDFAISNIGTRCESSQYAVPTGKAFIITAISGFENGITNSSNYTGLEILSGANCTGSVLTSNFDNSSSSAYYYPLHNEYGVGIPVAAGSTISVYSFNNEGYTYIHGYLVPAAWVSSSQVPNAAMPRQAEKMAAIKR